MHELTQAVDRILSETLPQSIRTSLDAALAAGESPRDIAARVRRQCGGRRGVALAVEAYLGLPQEG